MDASDWIALAAAVIALAGLPFTVIGIRIARESKKISKEAAASAERSADEAAAMTRIESERRAEERDRWHHELGPTPPAEIVAQLQDGRATASLFGSITVPRGYRIIADAMFANNGSRRIGVPSPLQPNQSAPFEIEQWPTGSTQPTAKQLRFRFWPPLESDGVDVWTCSCGRPTGESMDGDGHWEWTVPVVYNPPAQPATAPAAPPESPRGGLFH